MSIRIHMTDLTPEMIGAFLALQKRCFPKASCLSAEAVFRELSLDVACFKVALVKNELVGFLNYWEVAGEVHVHKIAVAPEFRRHRIGQKLFEHMMTCVSDTQVVHLELRISNHTARKFYESLGFSIVGRRHAYYRDNQEDAWLMSRGTDTSLAKFA